MRGRNEIAISPFSGELSRHGWRAADPPRRPVLFVNPGPSGGAAARARVAERARERDIEVVIVAPGQSLGGLAWEAVAAALTRRGWRVAKRAKGVLSC